MESLTNCQIMIIQETTNVMNANRISTKPIIVTTLHTFLINSNLILFLDWTESKISVDSN